MIDLTPHPGGTVIAVKALPGAKRDAVLGERAGALRIGVTASPERGKATQAVADVLAKYVGAKGSQVRLLTGETSRSKRFLIEGMGLDDLAKRLDSHLSKVKITSPGSDEPT